MSDREFARKLLDELLGPDRNKLSDQGGGFGINFEDEAVCRYFLVGFCPYQQFLNTKSDLGACSKRYHDERMRERFQSEADSRMKETFEREFLQLLDKLVSDLERKLRRGKDRLDIKSNDPMAALNPANDEFEEKRTLLDLEIKEKLARVEKLGEEGLITEAQQLMADVERAKMDLERLRQQEAENPSYRLEKRMEVCQTCGAFLIIGDAQKRIEAHFEGRQHNGWARIRQTLEELRNKYHHQHERLAAAREPGEIGADELMDSYRPTRRDSYSADRNHRRDRPDRSRDSDRYRGRDDYRDHYRRRDGPHDYRQDDQYQHRRQSAFSSANKR